MLISYAQNFEDVILWRALKHVERGFYIDIGAQDPVIDSVSLSFYERGWRGAHVEPIATYADALRRARVDEEVFECAVGTGPNQTEFFEVADTGLSTGKEEIALGHQASGFAVRRIQVARRPLSEILDASKRREIHWLKIDVEGMEDDVIGSWRPSEIRPWVVVVETTKPTLLLVEAPEPAPPEEGSLSWEPGLLSLGYDFVYFDGLNRYYVSRSQPKLKRSFGPGPNVFDGFVLTAASPFCVKVASEAASYRRQLLDSQVVARSQGDRLRNLEVMLGAAQDARARQAAELVLEQGARLELAGRTAELEAALTEERMTRTLLDQRLAGLITSTSWRITKPLRVLTRLLRSAGGRRSS
ncbi:hypothetical protein BH10PSE9_BH10PSE9_03780 [soil metagenome]